MANEIFKMNVVELRQKAIELKKRLAEVRFEKATGKLMDSTTPGKLRRELARVFTRESQIKTR